MVVPKAVQMADWMVVLKVGYLAGSKAASMADQMAVLSVHYLVGLSAVPMAVHLADPMAVRTAAMMADLKVASLVRL